MDALGSGMQGRVLQSQRLSDSKYGASGLSNELAIRNMRGDGSAKVSRMTFFSRR